MMSKSAQPRKQRKFRFNAPLHARQKFLHVHLSKEVRQTLGIKGRSVEIRKGDTVKVMSGKFKGKTGKVSTVSLMRNQITVEGINRKTAKGKEVPVFIHSSNVYITELNLDDKLRKEKVEKLKAKV